jgi:hypothetical protein
MSVSSTNPPETVFATWTDRKAPSRFRPLAIDVAIAFAVSWNPLVKSKHRAVNTTTTTMTVSMPCPSSG